jgi:hypothetical protein
MRIKIKNLLKLVFLLVFSVIIFTVCTTISIKPEVNATVQGTITSQEVQREQRTAEELIQEAALSQEPCFKVSLYLEVINNHKGTKEAEIAAKELPKYEKKAVQHLKSLAKKCSLCSLEKYVNMQLKDITYHQENCPTESIIAESKAAEDILIKTHDKVKSPVDIVDWERYSTRYGTYGKIVAKNTTDSEIEAFEYLWACDDAYGRGYDRYFIWQRALDGGSFLPGETISVERDITVCDGTVYDYVFPLSYKHYGKSVTKINLKRK